MTVNTYRLAKHTLGWDKAALRHLEQVARWTWLIIAAISQLRLARPIAEDQRQRWERRRSLRKLSPGRVRRDFNRLATLAGTPTSPPKPSKAGPGRPKGRRSTPASRYVIRRSPDVTQWVKAQEGRVRANTRVQAGTSEAASAL